MHRRAIAFLAVVFFVAGCCRLPVDRIDVDKIPVRMAAVDDVKIAYKEIGSGYPLVLIMGYAATMDVWDPVVLEELSRRYRVVIFDNRGMGMSTASDKEFTIGLFAEDAARLMDAIGIDRAHVLGYSMGTGIAQELALNHPEKVDKLILYAADCGGEEAVAPSPEAMRQLTDTSGTLKERQSRYLRLMLPEKWRKENPGYRKILPQVKEQSSVTSIDRQTKAMEGWKGCCNRLATIMQKTLLITGTEDVLTPPENSVMMAARIPGAWLVQLEGGGHGVMYQRPKEFAAVLHAFLGTR